MVQMLTRSSSPKEHLIIFLLSLVNLKTKKGKKLSIRSKDPSQYRLPQVPKQEPKTKAPLKKVKPKLKKVGSKGIRKIPIKKLKFGKKEVSSNLKAHKSEETIPKQLQWLQEDPRDSLLSRFIETPKGTRLGESIGIDKSRLIMKKKSKFYSIPLKAIKEKDDVLVLMKKINWKLATKLGESWRKKTLDVIDMKKTQSNRINKVIKIE